MSEFRHGRRAVVGAALLLATVAGAGAMLWAGHSTRTADAERAGSAVLEERLELVTATGVHAFDIEVASTPEQQARGLMFRTELAENKGMLFPYPEPRELTMWMRNTYIPLDMIFIRADGTVHRIEAQAVPFSERTIASQGPVAAVLEIAGGGAARLDLKPGDTVRHVHFGNAAQP